MKRKIIIFVVILFLYNALFGYAVDGFSVGKETQLVYAKGNTVIPFLGNKTEGLGHAVYDTAMIDSSLFIPGDVISISSKTISIKKPRGGEPESFAIKNDTKYSLGNIILTPQGRISDIPIKGIVSGDIKVGDSVVILTNNIKNCNEVVKGKAYFRSD